MSQLISMISYDNFDCFIVFVIFMVTSQQISYRRSEQSLSSSVYPLYPPLHQQRDLMGLMKYSHFRLFKSKQAFSRIPLSVNSTLLDVAVAASGALDATYMIINGRGHDFIVDGVGKISEQKIVPYHLLVLGKGVVCKRIKNKLFLCTPSWSLKCILFFITRHWGLHIINITEIEPMVGDFLMLTRRSHS
ncbi:hypothetical protein NQ317_004334 [Molorchus minor]|uniref:Uncharacterized protein n=1 Tax=Molorchus minor TaxID=1323400 RepID=A0ABQ9IW61_9CUCU|nr:hypothetical protein NQ317_004334 [Molorchus minor]